MSDQGVEWAIGQTVRGTLKTVLIMLGHHADLKGSVELSQADLAEECGRDVKTIRGALQDLEESGLIRRQARTASDGGRLSDRLTLVLDRPATEGGEP